MYTVAVMAFEQCYASSVFGMVDVLSMANNEYRKTHHKDLFKCKIYTIDGNSVQSSSNLTITPHKSISVDEKIDLLYLPAILGDYDTLIKSTHIQNLLKTFHCNGTTIVSVCAGSFFLAEAGLLKNRTVTTHWALSSDLQSKYDSINVKPQKMIIDEENIITAGGISAYLDLSLYLVQRFGSRDLSLLCSKILLIDQPRNNQTPYEINTFNRHHGDNDIFKVQQWIDNYYHKKFTISQIAEKFNFSERNLLRRFKKATGDSPSEYIQTVRLTKARQLLESSTLTIDEISWEIGYDDSSTFRRLFKKLTGLSPGAYRKRFNLLSPEKDSY